jgi:drug/metabolite transporter (DMT)-like permease
VPRLTRTRAYLALFLIATLWGTFPATAKLALRDFPPPFLTAIRCALASAFLVVLLLRSGAETMRGITADTLRAFFILGFLGLVISTQVTYFAIANTTASNAAILQSMTPIMVALGARLFLGERLRAQQKVGIAISMFGVLVVVTNGRLAALRPADIRVGDFLALFSLVAWAAYTVYGKRVLVDASPVLVTTAAYVSGTIMVSVIALLTAPLFPDPVLASPVAWAVLVYQAVPGAIAHVWWYRAVHEVGASHSAIFMNVTPIVGIALAAALLGEHIGAWQVAGAACVLAGVALTTRAAAPADATGAGPSPAPSPR